MAGSILGRLSGGPLDGQIIPLQADDVTEVEEELVLPWDTGHDVYRKAGAAGRWAARREVGRDESGPKYQERTLGLADDLAQHARRVVLPPEARLDEVARHRRDRLRVALLGKPNGDGAGRHGRILP